MSLLLDGLGLAFPSPARWGKGEEVIEGGKVGTTEKNNTLNISLGHMRSMWGRWDLKYDMVAYFVDEQSLKNED